jgi:hypothetical protein
LDFSAWLRVGLLLPTVCRDERGQDQKRLDRWSKNVMDENDIERVLDGIESVSNEATHREPTREPRNLRVCHTCWMYGYRQAVQDVCLVAGAAVVVYQVFRLLRNGSN